MKHYLLSTLSSIKELPVLIKLGTICSVVFMHYTAIIQLMVYIIFVDFLTGVWASYRKHLESTPNDSKSIKIFKIEITNKIILCIVFRIRVFLDAFKSKKMRNTVDKFIVYMIAVTVTALFEHFFIPLEVAGFTLTKIVTMFLVIVEIRSIFENLAKITKNNVFNTIFNMFQSKVEEKTGIDLDNDKQ